MQRSHGEVQGSESRHYELIRAATIWLIDVVQRAALKARNLQKSYTKKSAKPTEWTIVRIDWRAAPSALVNCVPGRIDHLSKQAKSHKCRIWSLTGLTGKRSVRPPSRIGLTLD